MLAAAALAVAGGVAGALALGGGSVGGGIGAIGRSAMESAIGLFAYSNHSGKAPKTTGASAVNAAQTAASNATARAREATRIALNRETTARDAYEETAPAAQSADPSTASAPKAAPVETAVGAAPRASGDDAPSAPAEGAPDAETAAAGAAPTADGSFEGDVIGDEEASAASDVASATRVRRLRAEPSWTDGSAPNADASEAADDVLDEEPEEYWDNEDGFEFDDESEIRDTGPDYSSFGKRDPFDALVTPTDQGGRTSDLVDPDMVRLVGVMWGGTGIYAIVEDGRRRGYVLREGDRILHGRVVSITRESVLIHQMIHGEFKSVELHLELPMEED
jgi:hypothetical protein